MTRDKKGTSYDGTEIIKIMEPMFEDMNNNIMKGFEFLAIQSWEKYIDFKKIYSMTIFHFFSLVLLRSIYLLQIWIANNLNPFIIFLVISSRIGSMIFIISSPSFEVLFSSLFIVSKKIAFFSYFFFLFNKSTFGFQYIMVVLDLLS